MRILTLILGVLTIIGGTYSFLSPAATFLGLGWLVGFISVVNGINNIIYYFISRKEDSASIWVLIGGVFATLMGALILGNQVVYVLTDLFIIYAFATWLTLAGFLQIGFAFTQKKNGQRWVGMLVLAIITIGLGIYSFIHPLFSALTVGMLMGFWIISQGINLVGFALSAKKTEKF